MSHIEKQKQYIIKGELAKIRELLSELELYGEVHPLIKTVKKTSTTNDDINSTYLITERPYQWIPINIRYVESVTIEENSIEYEISEIPLTKANLRYELMNAAENQVGIDFTLQITSKLLGKRVLMTKMMKAQDELMKSMESKILGRQTSKSK